MPSPEIHADKSQVTMLDVPSKGEARRPRVRVEFGALSHPGKVRGNNEDQFLVAQLAKSMQVCKASLHDSGETYSRTRKAT